MKKTFLLFLSILALMSIVACGSAKYDKLVVSYFDDSFNWDMTESEIKRFIKANQIYESDIEVEDYGDWKIISDDQLIFRLDEKGKIDMIHIRMGSDPYILDYFINKYGNYSKKWSGQNSYTWYCKMAGMRCDMTLQFLSGSSTQLEFVPKR